MNKVCVSFLLAAFSMGCGTTVINNYYPGDSFVESGVDGGSATPVVDVPMQNEVVSLIAPPPTMAVMRDSGHNLLYDVIWSVVDTSVPIVDSSVPAVVDVPIPPVDIPVIRDVPVVLPDIVQPMPMPDVMPDIPRMVMEAGVMLGLRNLALGRPATQSSTYSSGCSVDGRVATNATDGNLCGVFIVTRPCSEYAHTARSTNSWWQVDLGAIHSLNQLVLHGMVWNSDRNFDVWVSNSPSGPWNVLSYYASPSPQTAETIFVNLPSGTSGRFVRIARVFNPDCNSTQSDLNSCALRFCEVLVMGE